MLATELVDVNRIGRLYRINGNVEVGGRIGRLYPAYKHPWVIELGGEGSIKAENKGRRRS